MEEEDPWNGGGAKGGAAAREKPTRVCLECLIGKQKVTVAGASAAGRKDTRRSEKAKVTEEALF